MTEVELLIERNWIWFTCYKVQVMENGLGLWTHLHASTHETKTLG